MILHECSDWLVVDKPTGLATHAGRPGELGVVEWLALHLDRDVHVVSRLDRGTSGVLLLARDAAASARAEQIHESGTAQKTYEFLSPVDIRDLRGEDAWSCEDPVDGKTAATRFTRLGRSGLGSWTHYRAEISRGRRHQVRRHAAAAGVPLLGDPDYGGEPYPRLCLHCAEVRWPGIAEPIVAPRPAGFVALLAEDGANPHLAACHDRRGAWPAAVSDAFRAVHRDEIPDVPGAVDVYGRYANGVWFAEDADPDPLRLVLDRVAEHYGLDGWVLRTHRRNPHRRGLVTSVETVGDVPDTFTVTEHGLVYTIDLKSTQHTGLFLDQRDTRRRIMRRAAGARMANLFAFTCSFSVAAAQHGAEVIFSVDTARACLDTGKLNFAANGLDAAGSGKFIREDARRWLGRQERKREREPDTWQGLDLVICDPPVFAAARDGGQFAVEKEWEPLARSCARLMAPGAAAVFANNHRTGDHGFYRDVLEKVFGSVVDLRPPLDFPVLAGRPHHVRTFWCER